MDTLSFTTSVQRFVNEVYGYHFPLTELLVKQCISSGNTRFFYRINGLHTRRGAILKSHDYHYLLLNKNDLRAAGLQEGSPAVVHIWADTSDYGMDMPRELEAALDANEAAWQEFHALSPGKKRYLLYWVSQVKNEEKKIQRALSVAQHLTECQGELDFKKIMDINRSYSDVLNRNR